MKKKVLEESVLFISIIKWLFLASCVGAIVGLSTAIFLKLLDLSIAYASGNKYYFLFLPAAFFFSSIIVKYLSPEAEGHGTEKIIEAVHKRYGKISLLVIPTKLFTTILTIAAGGSAGKQGPCAQIGAGLSSGLSDLLKFGKRDRKKLVMCGISAGFASAFGTPMAGAIFGVEVLFVGGLLYEVLLPSFVSGIVSYQVSSALGITYYNHPINFVPAFSSFFFINVCLSGLFFGLCSFIFIEILKCGEGIKKTLKVWEPFRGIAGGLFLVLLTFLFSEKYLGLGLDTIAGALEGGEIFALAFFIKMVFTSITLNFGGSGGIITPIFFIGATAGNLFARLFGLDLGLFSAIGMISLLAGAANTPISASLMAVELFGPEVAPYAAVACIISFLMTGHRSVYPSQVLAMVKSSSIDVEKGKELDSLGSIALKLRSKSIINVIVKGLQRIRKR
jgi:H+/Cl- antiporter ClcA